jgi:hypothetical protein
MKIECLEFLGCSECRFETNTSATKTYLTFVYARKGCRVVAQTGLLRLTSPIAADKFSTGIVAGTSLYR